MATHSPFTVKVSRTVKEIDRMEWEGLFPPIVEGYNFFKTIDESLSGQFSPYYISLYEDSRAVLIAPCFAFDYYIDTTVEGPLKKVLSRIRSALPRLFTWRVLMCGCPAAEGRIGIKETGRPELVETLAREMEAIAAREGARVIAFKDFSEEYAAALQPLLKTGFRKIQSYPSVELDMKFGSFDEYLASLSRATRKDLRRKFRKVDSEAGIEMEVTNDIGGVIDEAFRLYADTLKRSDVQFERITKDFFLNITRNMPEETKYFIWRIGGRIVAFDLCLVSNGVLVDEYLGLDYDVAYRYHLYYVTYRDIVAWCIKNGIRMYESGALSYDPKKRLDFRFIHQYIYAKHMNRPMNALLGLLSVILRPENFDPAVKFVKHEKA